MPPVSNKDSYQQIKKKLWLDAQGDLVGTASAPTLAFGSANNTGVYEVADGQLGVTIEGTHRWNFIGPSLLSQTTGGALINGSASTATAPTLVPNKQSTNTGIGGASGTVSVIVGGVEVMTFDADGVNMTTVTGLNAVCTNDQVVCNNNEIVFS